MNVDDTLSYWYDLQYDDTMLYTPREPLTDNYQEG